MNRLIVLEIDGLDADAIVGDERLENIRRLLDAGIYGRLDGGSRADAATPAPYESIGGVCDRIDRGDAPLLHFVLDAPAPRQFDHELGLVLQRLDAGTAILIHTPRGLGEGLFALAGPGVPALGELHGVRYADLAPAILRLGGHDPGHSSRLADLIDSADPPDYSDDEAESIVRERLSGLGYIG